MDANASASASAFMDDLIVTAVSGSTLTTVDGSINLHLSGLMATGTGGIYGDGPDEGAKAVSRGEVLWSLTAQSSVGAFVNSGQCFQENILGEGAFSTCDSSVGPSGYLTIPMLFPVGEAFSLYLSLSVRGSAEATSSRLNSADAFWNVSYGNTFGFSEDRLAFELPAGFTANSLQAGIVDNRWDDPSTSNPTPVPEPATGILMASGMALAWIRRKRSVRH
jgi:hypothetical protein